MKYLLAFLSCCLLTTSAFAQAQTIIRERAKELRDQNNVRQGVPPPVQPGQPQAPASGAPAAPQPSPALGRLKADLAAITANSQPGLTQKSNITHALIAVALGGKPSVATASKFADEVVAAQVEKPLSAASLARFTQEIDALLNPAKYPQAKPDGIYADVQAIFQENGAKRNHAVAISDALKAAAGEARGGR